MKHICHDCEREKHGCKKIIAIEAHYPAFSDKEKPSKEREYNLKERIGHYLCLSCRNWVTGWAQGYPTAILILEDRTRESFRSRFDQRLWPGNAKETKFILYKGNK